MIDKEQIINNYIEAYNQFNIDQMLADMDAHIVFENIQNGETNMVLSGIAEFRQQAEQAVTYFLTRKQTIKSFKHFDNGTEIEIDYSAVLAIDLPNGLQKGQELHLTGRSVFLFENNKIVKLTDISC
jgi:alpha-D-ribose 1-methylphosphonate 5-triphosphate synthase subunit PhnH